MSDYKVIDLHDNQASVSPLSVQPWCTGIEYRAARRYAANGMVYSDGVASAELVFDYLTESELSVMDTMLGVSGTTPSNEVTVYMRDNSGTFGYYNATVVRPQIKRGDALLYENVRYLLTNLEAIAAP